MVHLRCTDGRITGRVTCESTSRFCPSVLPTPRRALDPQQFYYAYVMVPQSLLWGLAIYFGVKRARHAMIIQPVTY